MNQLHPIFASICNTILPAETPLQHAKRINKANPPRVSLERINQPGCPNHAMCEDCGQEAGEHVRSLGSKKHRCLTPEEMRRERDRIDQSNGHD